jgi:DedD protein
MRLLPIFRKAKPESPAGDKAFYSRAEEDSTAVRSRARAKGSSAKREPPADPALPEKKRARRRLVGAVALVLALVIGLPMLLDSEPKPLSNDISIQIPSKDKAPAPAAAPSTQLRLPEPATPSQPPGLDANEEVIELAPTKPAAMLAQTSAAEKKPQEEAKPPQKAKPTAPEALPELAQAKPAAKPEPKAAEKSVEKPAEKPAPHLLASARPDDAARAKAMLEGKFDALPASVKPVSDSKPGKFIVQVAALASADKVSELRGKLSEAGISSYTQKVATASGQRIRVRVGPFANKEEAEKTRAKLGKLGLNGTLIPA